MSFLPRWQECALFPDRLKLIDKMPFGGKLMVARNHAFDDERGNLRVVTFANQVFVGLQLPRPNAKRPQTSFIQRMKLRVLFQLTDNDVVGVCHAEREGENLPA